jgi:hypothetical protein
LVVRTVNGVPPAAIAVGGQISFTNALLPAYGSVSSSPPTTQISLNAIGHYYVVYAYGLNTSPAGANAQFALQISTNGGGLWTTYNTFSILMNNSFPIHTMSITVEVNIAPTLVRITNVGPAAQTLGFNGVTSPTLTNVPMAYINIVQIDDD